MIDTSLNYDVSRPTRPECSMYYFVVNIHITVPDKEGNVETDTLETEDHRNLQLCNQKTKVFGPVMPPQLEQKPETTSHVEVTEQQCDDKEKGREGKKRRNERRIQQRIRKVLYGSTVLFLLVQVLTVTQHTGQILSVIIVIRDTRRLMAGIRSEKCVVRRFCHANVYLHKPRQYSIAYYSPRLYCIAYCC